MTLEQAKAELRLLAVTGEALDGCFCSRETIPLVRVVIASDCKRHGAATEIYQSTRDDLVRRAGDPTPPVTGIGTEWMRAPAVERVPWKRPDVVVALDPRRKDG